MGWVSGLGGLCGPVFPVPGGYEGMDLGVAGWVWPGGVVWVVGWIIHMRWIHSHVVTKTLGVPSMSVSGSEKKD